MLPFGRKLNERVHSLHHRGARGPEHLPPGASDSGWWAFGKRPLPLLGLGCVLSSILLLSLAACGPSTEEIDQRIDQRVREVLDAMPTATPISFPTPLPTATPAPTAILQPTPTPLVLPSTPTPIVLPPQPTPRPTPTPQPTATPQASLDFSPVHRNAWRSVFFIDTPRRDGSGWLVEAGLILTNEHVVRGQNTVLIRQALDPPFPARVVATDSRRDIALLAFDDEEARLPPGTQPLPLGQISSNNIAQPLLALGYSGTTPNRNGTVGPATANVGVLSQITDFGSRSFGRNLVMDVPVDPGDSGGPVLNASGQVVGMTRAVTEETLSGQRVVGTFFAVHVDGVRDALTRLRRGENR